VQGDVQDCGARWLRNAGPAGPDSQPRRRRAAEAHRGAAGKVRQICPRNPGPVDYDRPDRDIAAEEPFMKRPLIAAAILSLAGLPAHAAGDAEKGAKDFGRCRACHLIANGDEVIQKGGRTGPNLYGLIGRGLGADPDFRYGPGFKEAADMGLVWDEEMLVRYVADPTGFMKEITGDPKAKSKMTFKMKNGEDVAAYLASVAPAPGATN
jgi:cytochrome c